MTSPDDWGAKVTPSPTVHTPPPSVRQVRRLTPRQIGAIGEIILELVLANIALAISGIQIFGVKPFDFLRNWAHVLQQRAQNAYWRALGLDQGIYAGVFGAGPAYDDPEYVEAWNNAKINLGYVSNTANTASTNANKANGDIFSVLLNAGVDTVAQLGQKLKSVFDNFADFLRESGQNTAATVGQLVKNAGERAQEFVSFVGNAAKGTASTLGTLVGGAINDSSTALTNSQTGLGQISQIVSNVGTNIVGTVVSTAAHVGQAISGAIQGTIDTWNNFWGGVFGGTHTGKNAANVKTAAAKLVSDTSAAQQTGDQAQANNVLTNAAIYNGYYGVGGSGQVAEVQSTIAAIKEKIVGGYTLQTLTLNSNMVTQGVWIRGNPTGGSFTLNYAGQTTSSLPYNATASQIQTALRALSSIGNNVTVESSTDLVGEPSDVKFIVTFNTSGIASPTAITANSYVTGGSGNVFTLGVWIPPWTSDTAPREFYAIAYGAGQAGGAGVKADLRYFSNVPGGNGGTPGGYAAIEIDASSLAPCAYTVAAGPAGSTSSTVGAAGPESAFYVSGQPSLQTVSGQNFVSNVLGYYTTNQSAPGKGGNGGWGYVYSNGSYYGGWWGENGGGTLLASSGAGGIGGAGATLGPNTSNNSNGISNPNYINAYSGTVPVNGSVGGNATLTGRSRAGGGGGGGGGGSYSYYYYYNYGGFLGSVEENLPAPGPGGLGANGGFPGGGGGGGGGSYRWIEGGNPNVGFPGAGNGGYGGNGVIILIWK